MSSTIPASPAYDVFISQLIRYARACSLYGSLMLRMTRLSNKLLVQGYAKKRLKSSLKKIYGRYGDPREDAGGLSREYVIRIPNVS